VSADPMEQFRRWFDEAAACGLHQPDAAVVATADGRGRPSARFVLVRGVDERGFAFYTDRGSRKGQDLAANPYAALCVSWYAIGRQVRIEGPVEQVGDDESDAYWAGRPRGGQLAARTSMQSSVVTDREDLERRFAAEAEQWEGREVPRPERWGGFRIVPEAIELWQGRPDRLHDRLRYRRKGDAWLVERLSP